VVGGVVLRPAVEMLAAAAVAAFDHAVIRHDDFGALGSAASVRKAGYGEPIRDTGRREHKGAGRPPTDVGRRARARDMAAPCD
jgi:hypothetical protein